MLGFTRKAGLALVIRMGAAAAVTVASVVRLGLHSRREELEIMQLVGSQLEAPEDFRAKLTDLEAAPTAESHDVLDFQDGRTFERYSRPQRVGHSIVGRVWSFRDVTPRRRAQEQAHRAMLDLAAQTEKLLGSGKIDHVNFTGSVAGGRAIEKAAAGTFMTLGLELGGKDPAYVLPDAKLDQSRRRRLLQFRPVLLRHRARLCAREGL